MEKFKLNSHEAFNNLVNWLCEQREYERFNLVCEIKQFRAKRSNNQNSLYWLYMACLERETGNDKDYLHELFLKKYAPRIEVLGELMPIRSKKLDSKQMTDYIEKIVIFASSELSIILPDPKDKYFAEFESYYQNYI